LRGVYRRLADGSETFYTSYVEPANVLFLLMLAAIALACFAFWLWMLVECVTKEPDTGNNKICWVLIIVFAHIVGALIYCFVRRPRRYAEVGR
jgi:hypothetical protein